jgi:hypothetical protein
MMFGWSTCFVVMRHYGVMNYIMIDVVSRGGAKVQFFLVHLSTTGMPPSRQLLKENSHDYVPRPTMKSKDFREMKGF